MHGPSQREQSHAERKYAKACLHGCQSKQQCRYMHSTCVQYFYKDLVASSVHAVRLVQVIWDKIDWMVETFGLKPWYV